MLLSIPNRRRKGCCKRHPPPPVLRKKIRRRRNFHKFIIYTHKRRRTDLPAFFSGLRSFRRLTKQIPLHPLVRPPFGLLSCPSPHLCAARPPAFRLCLLPAIEQRSFRSCFLLLFTISRVFRGHQTMHPGNVLRIKYSFLWTVPPSVDSRSAVLFSDRVRLSLFFC